jgi:transcriptional regulator with XRE-family HTH domain
MAMDKKQFGERLRIVRLRKKLRQIDVSIALEEYDIDMNQIAIGKIERGERNLCVHELAAMVEILDVSVEWVVKGGELSIN